ncbi:MAG TPA: alpha-amylase family glycosyl hydrolase [Acidimicrobiales bacterium]|nr:alpha-amylase family glycosyl hydrolase [Acidimicrobiales bacterium]
MPPHPTAVPALGLRPTEAGFRACTWAATADAVAVRRVEDDQCWPLHPAPGPHGLWTGDLPGLQHGDRYLLDIDGTTIADPWSRWQPDGIDGPAAALDPGRIGATPPGQGARPPRPWLPRDDAVIYELHVGAFSFAGDLDGVAARLEHLVHLGVTHLELLPVGGFPGRHGWGYDAIAWQAVHQPYGGPEALVRLIDLAHVHGLGVIVDVVFNHVGPGGGQRYQTCGPFFTDRHQTPWGDAINVDGPGSDPVRATIWQTAEWWLGPMGADGLRVDACHAIVDQSARHVLAELTARARAVHPDALLIAESGLNDPRTVRPEAEGGWGFDADWADDFHHALRTTLTDDREAWLGDFGEVGQLAKAFGRPYVHDGSWSAYRGRHFGAPPEREGPERFVVFAQNHDQIGNRPLGDRLPAAVRPLAMACTLLSPSIPMLFMGEERDEPAPFQFFSDHQDPFLADATRDGRRREFAAFARASGEEVPDPQDEATFQRSRLTWPTTDSALAAEDRCRTLIRLRRRIGRAPARVEHDEAGRWLRVQRGRWTFAANLSDRPNRVAVPDGHRVFVTHGDVALEPSPEAGQVAVLPPFGGVVVEGPDAPVGPSSP